jgi:uncharacterized delta-60 repeat protein
MARGRTNHGNRFFETLETRTLYSSGGFDPSFGSNGVARLPLSPLITMDTRAEAVQTDGKIVVAGTNAANQFAVARYNTDGTPDTSFGTTDTGVVFTSVAAGGGATSMAIDSQGRIILAGTVEPGAGDDSELGLVRYLPSGQLDATFDRDGILTYNDFGFSANFSDWNGVAAQTDGKVVVVGTLSSGKFLPGRDADVLRFNADGSIDDGFADGGEQRIDFGDQDAFSALAIDYSHTQTSNPNWGKIICVGGSSQTDGKLDRMIIVRLKTNGDVDEAFQDGGTIRTRFLAGYQHAFASAVVVQPSGTIVVGGEARDGQLGHTYDFALLGLGRNGDVNEQFGTTGTVTADFGGTDDIVTSLANGPSGDLLVAGCAGGHALVQAYSSSGVLDTRFGTGGTTRLPAIETVKPAVAAGTGDTLVVSGGKDAATARLFDIDVRVGVLSVQPIGLEQGPLAAKFSVTRNVAAPFATRVYINIGGTATQPSLTSQRFHRNDYFIDGMTIPLTSALFGQAPSHPYVDIPAFKTSATVTITPVDDTAAEGDETATFTIADDPSYTHRTVPTSASSMTVVIRDNDLIALTDTADAYVRDGNFADANFGTSQDIEVKKGNTGVNRQAYLKFDISSLDPAHVNNVKLQLFGSLNNTNQQNVATSVLGSDNTTWSESQITFNNRPPTTGGAIATTTIVNNTPQLYTWDITAYVKAQLAAGHKTITLVLQNIGNSDPFATFASREAGSNGPQLLVS